MTDERNPAQPPPPAAAPNDDELEADRPYTPDVEPRPEPDAENLIPAKHGPGTF